MTSRNRIVATLFTLLMLAPAIAVLAPAATAQSFETVPTKPQIRFETIPRIRQDFFMRFPSSGSDPNAANDQVACPNAQDTETPFIGLEAGRPSDNSVAPLARTCIFGTSNVPGVISSITFDAPASMFPKRRVSFTGNDSIIYHHAGTISEGVTLTVELFSDATSIARKTIVGDNSNPDPTNLTLTLIPGQRTVELLDNRTFRLVLTGTPTTGFDPVNNPGLPSNPTWTVSDTGTFLETRPDNALRAATWVTDEKDTVKDVFAPVANESNLPADRDRRVVGHFALHSAFGYADASRGNAPRFSLLFDGRAREVGAGGLTVLTGTLNASASVESLGVAVWTLPAGTINYRGFQAGEYTLAVDKTHHQGGSISRAVEKKFVITAQSVRLFPYFDARVPGLTETQAHSVQAGSSTTYILGVNNTGSVNDTFTINLTAPNAPAGWGATIGGPDIQGTRLFVPARETRIFTVTVNAPGGITSGEIIHLVNVTSTVDPGTRSTDLTLVSRISNELVREVGVIFLAPDLSLEPGVETHFPVYVWNRGTRAQNVSLEIRETILPGWTADLAQGSGSVDRIVLGGVQPGDIASATLKVTGPLSAATASHDITLNATSQDAAGVSHDRTLRFLLRQVAGVQVQVLDAVGALQHQAEVSGPSTVDSGVPGQPPVPNPNCNSNSPNAIDCTNDGVDGVWFRVWITNTGRVTDTFTMTADTFRKQSGCTGAWIPGTGADAMSGDFNFYARSPSGVPQPRNSIENLLPGKTAELYVWLPVNRNAQPCDGEDFYSFVVQAKGSATGAIGRASAKAVAVNTPQPHSAAVHLEGVVRESGYSPASPLVDIQNATKRSIVGAIEPGKNTTFYVRMTNAARWAAFNDGNGVRRAPDLHVYMVGIDYEGGWNVSIRPVKDAASNSLQLNPYVAEYNLTNENAGVNPTRREAWIDQELEVVVQAPTPENGTVLAGTRHEFSLIAEGANGTNAQSTLEIATIVSDLANITLRADQSRIRAHAGDPGAFLLYVANNGSSPATVTLRASIDPNTPNAGAWQLSSNAQTFPLAAFKNRSIALLVTPPTGATAGSAGEVNVTIEYARSPFFPTQTTNITTRLFVDVAALGNLQLTSGSSATTIAPGGTANFTMQLRNSGSIQMPFRLTATSIPNWTVSVSPDTGTLNAGETRTVVLVMVAPRDVVDASRFETVVRAEETGAGSTDNFDTLAFTANIQGGSALPRVSVPNLIKRVDRAGIQHFEVQVQNVGTIAGRLPLEVRSQDPSWLVGIIDSRGNNISSIQVGVNELVNINVTVRAPFTVPERTVVPVEITAYSPDQTQAAKATLQAEVHDYGVQVTLQPSTRDGLPGVPTEFIARLKNTGNENDTLNLSVNLVDLPDWSVALSSEDVRLEPGQELEVRATIRSPSNPLPSPRTYTFPFWVGTRGGQAVNISKNMTVNALVTVPNYRAYDVDRDGQLEATVDLDKRTGNGFEEFRELFADGLATQVIAKPLFEGRTTYFLDIPRDRPYDGVADVWFNPETVHAFDIVHAPDINGDGTPDYLLDSDRDGKVDKAFDTATERFWNAVEVKIYGDERIQYLVDVTGDGRPDRFYDPEGSEGRGLVTRTQSASSLGDDYVGIDVDDDERVDYYYNTRTEETSGAEVQNFGGFALKYWYFFLLFAVLVLVTVMLVVRRKKAPPTS